MMKILSSGALNFKRINKKWEEAEIPELRKKT